MDRQIVWPGAIPLETDILNAERNAMLAFAAIGSALFGASTTANGLVVAPTAPASMSVSVGPGQIYAVGNLDNTAYSSLSPDTAHQIVKQGINLDPVSLACAAPTTAGYSINYLIEASFSEADDHSVVLPYYNASDPTQAYSGPANSGASQPTRRTCSVVVTAKPGAAAATGSQTTPAADAGYIGLYVVTVPYGATSITAGMISAVSGAPVVPTGGILAAIKGIAYASRAVTAAGTSITQGVTPDGIAQAVQGGGFLYAVAGGSANALTASLTPAPAAITVGMEVILKVPSANTGAATLNLNGSGAAPITMNGSALKAGVIKASQLHALVWDGANWQLKTPNVDGVISYSFGLTGYEIWSHGKIEQWGTGSHTDNTGAQTVTFPTAFPTACMSTIAGNAASGFPSAFHGTSNGTTTNMVVYSSTVTGGTIGAASTGTAFRWRAKGY